MSAEGKFCFATCSKTVKIPVGYFLRKASEIYANPHSLPNYVPSVALSKFFDHWCLTEIINGLGGHSIL